MKNLIKKIILEEIRLSIFEGIEHVQNLYKSWATKRSGNPEEALKLMDYVIKYQKRLPKKDFAKYNSYEELRKDIVKIKSEEKSTDITKIYEDKDLLVMAANTWEASCKYGAGSKWCTTARDDSSYWRRHNQTGTEFFWIFKNKSQDDPDHKFSYHIKIDGTEPDWCNAVNRCMPTKRLPEGSYPKQHPKYNEIIEKLQEFHNNREDMGNVKSYHDELIISRENKREVESLIDENYREIMGVLINNEVQSQLYGIAENNLEDFMSEEAWDLVSEYFDVDVDDDMMDDYIDELTEHLQKIDFIFDDNMMDQITRDLAFLVYDVLLDVYNFDENQYFDEQMQEQNIKIVDVVEKIVSDENLRYLFDEVFYEVASAITSDEFYHSTRNFLENYKK
jgi:hypothetical protein